ncbi:MAG: hypothetical protein M1280_02010 [Actinobacteria bacterium]|nr:hypothetical protein [Actinomycetota bacterium]
MTSRPSAISGMLLRTVPRPSVNPHYFSQSDYNSLHHITRQTDVNPPQSTLMGSM